MSKSGREYFRLGAESYSSLGRAGKKEKIACPLFEVFACGQVLRVSHYCADFLACALKPSRRAGVARFLKDFQDFKDMQDFFGSILFEGKI